MLLKYSEYIGYTSYCERRNYRGWRKPSCLTPVSGNTDHLHLCFVRSFKISHKTGKKLHWTALLFKTSYHCCKNIWQVSTLEEE